MSRIDEIQERFEKTTPDWKLIYIYDKYYPGIYGYLSGNGFGIAHIDTYRYDHIIPEGFTSPDAEFILHAHEDIPFLLDEIKRLQGLIE